MRFWDSSALVPLLLDEPTSTSMVAEYLRDPEQITWWATGIECVSALARAEREGPLSPATMADAVGRLEALELAWAEVQPTDQLRELAVRLLRVTPCGRPTRCSWRPLLSPRRGTPGR